jgi:hypothetical protein
MNRRQFIQSAAGVTYVAMRMVSAGEGVTRVKRPKPTRLTLDSAPHKLCQKPGFLEKPGLFVSHFSGPS